MKRNTLRIILPILFVFPFILTAQQNWYICEGEDKNVAEIMAWQALVIDKSGPDSTTYKLNIDALVKYPSCPYVNDGFIQILSVYTKDRDSRRFEDNDFNPKFVFVASTQNSLIVEEGLSLTDIGYADIIMNIKVGNKQASATPFKFPPIQLRDEIILVDAGNETCPGASDGYVELSRYDNDDEDFEAMVPPSNYIQWEDGFINPGRADLSAGIHRFQRRHTHFNNLCCADGSVTINTNACSTAILEDDFSDQVPGNWFINPPGSFKIENNAGVFSRNGCIYIPFNLRQEDKAVAIKMNVAGEAELSILDMQMNEFTSMSVMGGGNVVSIKLNESNTKGFYLKVAGEQGTIIDNLSIIRFEEEIGELSASFSSGQTISKLQDTETVCVGELFPPYDGLSIEGGISPLSFMWDLDGDGNYEDASGLENLHQFDAAGSYTLSLLISDAIGQSTVLDLDYEVFEGHDLSIGVPALNLSNQEVNAFTVCQDAEAFSLVTASGEGAISSNSPGYNNGVFDPMLAGVGEHIIEANGDACDIPSLVIIDVIAEEMVAIEDLSVIYQCEDIINLNALLSDDINGVWIVNDSFAVLNDTLIPLSFDPGLINLRFEAGADFCNPTYSLNIEVQEAPIADLELMSLDIETDAPIFDLNDLLSTESTSGGSWSGPNVEGAQFFNPAGLAPGTYSLIYTVGEGACQTEAELMINLMMSTSVENINEGAQFDIFPNPMLDQLNICIDKSDLGSSIKASIFNLDGRLILTHSIASNCTEINIEELESGVYILYLNVGNASLGMKTVVKM